MNTSSSILYCNECGAALTHQETYCPVCHHQVGAPVPLPTSPPVPPLKLSPPAPEPTTHLRQNTVLNYRYIILEAVGEGGFGLVYKAKDQLHRNRLVAIKQINLSSLSPKEMIEATDSYNREIKHLSRLHHKHLPAIYDHFTDPGHWYIVMDFIEGVTLEEYLEKRKGKGLPLRQVKEVGLVLCDVLYYLHTQSPAIIFRDVKPANIMRTRRGQYYLIDFGIARQYDPEKKRDTGPLGSPGYASPEQYGRAQTDARSDIYGLGATLQTLLTGKDPQELENHKRAQKRLAHAPARWRALLQQMVAEEPTKRPASILEVRYRLEACESEGLIRRTLRKIWHGIRSIFQRTFLIWFLTGLMAVSLLISKSVETGQYLVLIVLLLAGLVVLGITEELEGQLRPLKQDDLKTILAEVGRRALFPCFGLTLFCWLYYLGYQESIGESWIGLYYLYYLFISLIVVGFCVYTVINMLRKLLRAYRHGHNERKMKAHIPLQRQRR